MKRKIKSLLIYTICFIFIIEIFINTKLVINSFFDGTKLFFKSLFPNIFIFFTITDILNNYDFFKYIRYFIGNFFSKIFHISINTTPIFFISILSGFPSNAKLIKEGLDNGEMNELDATKLLTFTHFANPLFIINTIGITFLNNKKLGLLILFIHYFTNIIVGLLFRNIYIIKKKEVNYLNNNHLSFINLLKKSFINTFNSIIIIYSLLIFFYITINVFNNIIYINPLINSIITCFIEITSGFKEISLLLINNNLKALLIIFFLSFGGLSIHMQTFSLLSNYKINYFIYFIARIIHASIATLLLFLFINCY